MSKQAVVNKYLRTNPLAVWIKNPSDDDFIGVFGKENYDFYSNYRKKYLDDIILYKIPLSENSKERITEKYPNQYKNEDLFNYGIQHHCECSINGMGSPMCEISIIDRWNIQKNATNPYSSTYDKKNP